MSDLSLTKRLSDATGDLTRQEQPAAALTLTRTSTFTVGTGTFTTVTWQSQVRGQGITWSGSDITIPTDGYYLWTLQYQTSATANGYFQLQIGGVNVANSTPTVASTVGSTLQVTSLVRYFSTGDVVTLRLYSTGAATINVNATGNASESPILNIVQLTSVVV